MCSLRIGVQHHSMCDLPSVPRLLQWVFESCFNILTISFWCTGNEKAVPCDILQLKGVAHLLFHNTPSVSIPATPRSDGPAAEADEIGVLASAVLSRAAIHRTDAHQENSKLLIFYLICLNPLNLKLSKIREEKRTGLDLFFLMFLNFFLILLKSTCCQLLLIFKKKLSAFKDN